MSWMDKVREATSGGGGSSVTVESLSVTQNGTYTAPSGKAYSPVDVSVANSYSAGDEGKVVKNGALAAQSSATYNSNGTYDTTEISSVEVSVSGGGGASNVVTGTFKGTTTGVAMDVTLNYSGSGWPIAVAIFVEDGRHGDSTFRTTVQRYAVSDFFASKTDPDDAPDYSGNNTTADSFDMSCRYKSSASNGATYNNGGGTGPAANNNDATDTAFSTIVNLRSKTKMSVYIATTSYGFMANINYRYYVIYSS